MAKERNPSSESPEQKNDSGHRSFHPETYAPEPGPGGKTSEKAERKRGETTGESQTRRGEERARKGSEKGRHDTGPRGRSQRPSGTKDASAYTGVDPQGPREK